MAPRDNRRNENPHDQPTQRHQIDPSFFAPTRPIDLRKLNNLSDYFAPTVPINLASLEAMFAPTVQTNFPEQITINEESIDFIKSYVVFYKEILGELLAGTVLQGQEISEDELISTSEAKFQDILKKIFYAAGLSLNQRDELMGLVHGVRIALVNNQKLLSEYQKTEDVENREIESLDQVAIDALFRLLDSEQISGQSLKFQYVNEPILVRQVCVGVIELYLSPKLLELFAHNPNLVAFHQIGNQVSIPGQIGNLSLIVYRATKQAGKWIAVPPRQDIQEHELSHLIFSHIKETGLVAQLEENSENPELTQAFDVFRNEVISYMLNDPQDLINQPDLKFLNQTFSPDVSKVVIDSLVYLQNVLQIMQRNAQLAGTQDHRSQLPFMYVAMKATDFIDFQRLVYQYAKLQYEQYKRELPYRH